MSLTGHSADFLFSGLPDSPVIKDGAVVVDSEGVVRAVGSRAELAARHTEIGWTKHSGFLVPGLVNAHVHLELSALRGHTKSGGGFGPWVSSMMEARGKLAPEQDAESIDAAVGQLLRSGTAAVGEVSNSLASVEALSSAPLLGRVFHEVFGMAQAAAESTLRAAQAKRASLADWPARLSYALAPHTLYSLHPSVVQQVLSDAREAGTLTSLHLAEHAAERAFLADGTGPFAEFLAQRGSPPADWPPPGVDPVTYAQQLGVLGDAAVVVHLADARAPEIAAVAASGAPVVLCPRSNLFIELKLPPLGELLAAGIEPGLGTDSLASNTTLDVLAEASALRDRFPTVDPRHLIAMATSGGARALGLSHRVGALEVGRAPGLVLLPCPADASDPCAHVLRYHSEPRQVLARPALPNIEHSLEDAP